MKLRFASLLTILILPFFHASAQESYSVSGRVIDAKSHEPLPFVNIVINNSNTGGTSDIDGKFRLRTGKPVQSIRLSYVGYDPLTVTLAGKTKDLLIELSRKEIDLREVEIFPGINPAHRIIRNAIDNRDINDPEKVKTFSYTAYDKTVFTVDADTSVKSDFSVLFDTAMMKEPTTPTVQFEVSPEGGKMDSARRDSGMRMIKKLIDSQYLFLMENVTKRKFMAPDRNYNQVVATKMSGFKDPILVFLSTQIQSFSFYKPFISIMMKDYVNPIGSGSFSRYFFKIEDTTYSGKDTNFIISFRPRKGTNFDGLKGVVTISSHHWAIGNVTAEPWPAGGGITIRIKQLYELIDGEQWFPVQLNTDVSFNNMHVGNYKAIGSGRSYIRDIVLNPDLVRREFNHLDVEVDKDATSRDESYWNQYRTDSLTRKDRNTYRVLDSIGQAENFDKMAKTLQTVLSGRIPWGPVDIDLNRILGYNTYEGLIAGVGLHTNGRLADRFRIGGFCQYAFAINTFKYGGDASYRINRRHDLSLSAAAWYDLVESGGTSFPSDPGSLLSGNFRPLFLKKLDRTRHFGGTVGFRALKYMLFNAGIYNDLKRSTTWDLATNVEDVTLLYDQFNFTTVSAGFKWAYGEKFIQTINNKISLGTDYPIVWLQYTRGLKDLFGSGYAFNRVDLQVKKTFNIKYLGKLTTTLNAGYIDRALPACNLYYAPAGYRFIALYAPGSFATMRSNEFLSDRYASLSLYHDFGYLLFKGKKWFHPEFALAQNIGFGWLDHTERYNQLILHPHTMDLGYYESGLLVNNLINLQLYKVGIGAFYRWGPYSFDKTLDNFGFKVSLLFPF